MLTDFSHNQASVRNGRNQKAVVDPEGKYPIYGSGGIMGYANDYLCESGSTIIGRKFLRFIGFTFS